MGDQRYSGGTGVINLMNMCKIEQNSQKATERTRKKPTAMGQKLPT